MKTNKSLIKKGTMLQFKQDPNYILLVLDEIDRTDGLFVQVWNVLVGGIFNNEKHKRWRKDCFLGMKTHWEKIK